MYYSTSAPEHQSALCDLDRSTQLRMQLGTCLPFSRCLRTAALLLAGYSDLGEAHRPWSLVVS